MRFYINVRDNKDESSVEPSALKEVKDWTNNSFFDYFVSEYEERKEVKNWIDLEHGIKNYTRTLLDYFINENEKIKRGYYQANHTIIDYSNYTQNVANVLCNAHAIGRTGTNNQLELTNKFLTFQGLYDIEEIVRCFAEELNNLEDIVAFYLKKVEPVLRSRNCDYHRYPQIEKINPSYVISFNYTNTICELYDIDNSNVTFVHGNLDNEGIVLGYEDSDCNNQDIVFKKYYRRLIKRTKIIDNKRLYENKDGFLTMQHLHIFGHSLDLSDEDILTPLLSSHNVTIYYLDDNDYAQKIRNLFLLMEKEEVLDRIYDGKIEFEKIEQMR